MEIGLRPCPECGSDFVSVASSRDMGLSEISCSDCRFTLQRNVPEERIEQIWNKLDRSRMPSVEVEPRFDGPFPALETHPFEYRLRYEASPGVDMWAPAKTAELDRLLGDPHFQVRRRSHDFDMRDLAKRQRAERAEISAAPQEKP